MARLGRPKSLGGRWQPPGGRPLARRARKGRGERETGLRGPPARRPPESLLQGGAPPPRPLPSWGPRLLAEAGWAHSSPSRRGRPGARPPPLSPLSGPRGQAECSGSNSHLFWLSPPVLKPDVCVLPTLTWHIWLGFWFPSRRLPHPPQSARREEANIWKSLQLSRFKGILCHREENSIRNWAKLSSSSCQCRFQTHAGKRHPCCGALPPRAMSTLPGTTAQRLGGLPGGLAAWSPSSLLPSLLFSWVGWAKKALSFSF